MTEETITDPVSGNDSTEFSYDAVGNRLTSNDSINGLTTYVYDNNDRLLSQTVNGQTTTFTYDNNGNTLSEYTSATNQATYTWNDLNEMVTATVINSTGTHQMSYRYNSDGVRVAEVVDGQETRYLIDANRPFADVLEEYSPGGAVQVSYVYGRDLISESRGGVLSFYLRDASGSIRDLTNASGAVTDSYTYDAFGNLTASTGSTVNNYRYDGEQYDPNLGQYYLRARYYDPDTGRFTRMDSFEGIPEMPLSLNKYLYTDGDPVNGIDPSGMFVGSISDFTVADKISTELDAIETEYNSVVIDSSLNEAFPEPVSPEVPEIANVGRAPLSIAERIKIGVARETMNLIASAAEEIELSPLLGFPIILWGRELPETTLHTFEAITGISTGFKDGFGWASPFLGYINPGFSDRTWLKNGNRSEGSEGVKGVKANQ